MVLHNIIEHITTQGRTQEFWKRGFDMNNQRGGGVREGGTEAFGGLTFVHWMIRGVLLIAFVNSIDT